MNGQPTWVWWVRPHSKGLSKMHKYTPGHGVTWCGSSIPVDTHHTDRVPYSWHKINRICQLCLAERERRKKPPTEVEYPMEAENRELSKTIGDLIPASDRIQKENTRLKARLEEAEAGWYEDARLMDSLDLKAPKFEKYWKKYKIDAALAAKEECDHRWKYQAMGKVCEKCGKHYIPKPIQPTDGGNDE